MRDSARACARAYSSAPEARIVFEHRRRARRARRTGSRGARARACSARAVLHRVDERQRRLAFGEIVADVLADHGVVARVVEHVVDQLKSGAQMRAVGRHRLLGLRRPRHRGSRPAASPPRRASPSCSGSPDGDRENTRPLMKKKLLNY